MGEPLWRPSAARRTTTRLWAFREHLRERWGVDCPDYPDLYRFSCEQPERFWAAVWQFCGVIGDWDGATVLRHPQAMPGAHFFPEATLSFAENLLRGQASGDAPGDAPGDAIVAWGEGQHPRRVSRDQLRRDVARLARALAELGVGPGDRVAGFLPNVPEAVIALLASASLGAIWSSCSPDFGPSGVIDRFGQIQPKVLFAADGYVYKGQRHDSLARLAAFLPRLPSVERVVVVPYTRSDFDLATLPGACRFDELLAQHGDCELTFTRFRFDAPLYILYSSGTTGRPKCIVHGAGGTLLQHLKEHQLQCDIRPADRVFYFTTCGWMMWNWLVSALASEATLLLYDGSPFDPAASILFDYADAEQMTFFGTSARYLDELRRRGLSPRGTHRLSSLRTVASTGSPLVAESFDYVYEHVKRDVCLSSISGGTDIVGCFVGGNPIGPVWRGEIQARCLGMAVEVYDPEGKPVRGQKGELVCTKPFPSLPLGFHDDPAGERYRQAYFARYPGVWHHGDWAELSEHEGVIIYGRSDATLNPGGVRIGTAEIYRQVAEVTEVDEALAVSQRWGDDERILLFVKLRAGALLDEALVARIKARIRDGASPKHVPARVYQVPDLPRTRSGKIVELAVRELIHGRPVVNTEALANPEALAFFAGLDLVGSSSG